MKIKITILFATLAFCACSTSAQEITRNELLRLFYQANQFTKSDDIQEAIDTYGTIISFAPTLWEPYLALGVLYSIDGDSYNPELAVQAYKKYLALNQEAANDSIRLIIENLEISTAFQEQAPPDIDESYEEYVEGVDIVEQAESFIVEYNTKQEPAPEYKVIDNFSAEYLDEAIPLTDVFHIEEEKIEVAFQHTSIVALKDGSKFYNDPANSFLIANSHENSFWIRDDKLNAKSVAEIKGKIINNTEEALELKIGHNTVKVPASNILMIRYEDGTNSIISPDEVKNVVKAYRQTAIELHKNGQTQESIKFFERILEIDPSNVETYRILGEMYSSSLTLSDLEKAQAYFSYYIQQIEPNSKYYERTNDRLADLQDRINNYGFDQDRWDYFKSLEGTWVSDHIFLGNAIPTWVFNIICRDDSYGIELHPGCLRYSGELYSGATTPLFESDSTLQFHFVNGRAYTPSNTAYFAKHIFTEITDPRYLYLLSNQTEKVSEERFYQREEETQQLHNAIEATRAQDKAHVNKTKDEFKIHRISDNVFHAECVETIKATKEEGGLIQQQNTISCYFFKIPEELHFALIGRNNILITNDSVSNQVAIGKIQRAVKEYKKYSKRMKSGKNIDFEALTYPFHLDAAISDHFAELSASIGWYKKEANKKALLHVGKILLSSAVTAVGVYGITGGTTDELILTLSDALYRGGAQAAGYFFETTGEALSVNPFGWNIHRMDELLRYYQIGEAELKPVIEK